MADVDSSNGVSDRKWHFTEILDRTAVKPPTAWGERRDRLYDPECRSLHGTLGRSLRDAGIDIALYDLTTQA